MKTPSNRAFSTASTTWALTSMGPRSHQLVARASVAPEIDHAPRWSHVLETSEHGSSSPINDSDEKRSPLLEGCEKDEQ